MPLSIQKAELVLLSGLRDRLQEVAQKHVWVPFSEIPNITTPSVSAGYAIRIAEILEAQQFVELESSIEDLNAPDEIAITIEGIRHLESKEDEEKTVSAEASNSGDADREITVEVPAKTTGTFGGSVYGRSVYGRGQGRGADIGAYQSGGRSIGAFQASVDEAGEGESVPASDRAVSTKDNSPEYQDLIEKLKKAEKVIRETNAWAGEEREEIRSHVQIGIELLKNPKVYLGAITYLLLVPLYSAYSAALEEEARIVIDAAIAALKAHFGI